MLQELGFNNSYILSYKTATSAHATVIAQDPKTGKIIKFNYGEVSEADKSAGTSALNMNSDIPDHTLTYRIYDHNAKAVTSIPSQLTQVLREATNFNDKMIFDKRYQLGKVGFESSDGRLGGNFFSGKTSAGEQINGAAFYYKMNRPYVNTDLGVAYASSEKENDYYYVKTNELYGRFHNELYSPSYNINNTKTEAFVGSNVDIALAYNTDVAKKGTYTLKGKNQLETHNSYEAGVRSEGKLSDGKTSFKGEIFASSYIDFAHAGKQDRSTLIYEGTVIRAGAQQQITPDMVVLADSSVLIRRYGTSLVTTAGLENTKEKYKFYVGARAPLSGDIADFLPGSEKVVFLGGEKESAKGYYIKFDLEKNISSSDTSANLKVGKKF